MASGDRINIADKDTLDAVNSKLGTLEDSAGSGSVISILKSIDSSSQSYPTQIYDTSKFVVGGTIYPASSTATVLNLTGSGYLYLALATHIVAASNITGALQIYRDNQLIINRNIATTQGSNADSSGIIHSDYVPTANTNMYIVGNTHRVLSQFSSIQPFNTSNLGVTLIPVPLRFNSSLRISLSGTSSAVSVSYIYLLD